MSLSTRVGIIVSQTDADASPVMTLSHEVTEPFKSPRKASFVFNRYGNDRYFLSQIWSSPANGIELPKGRKERELITSKIIAQAAAVQVVIAVLPLDR